MLAPLRGSNVGVWDVPVNSDWTALDGLIGGNTTISLSSATTLLLSVPATGSVTPSAGPNQSQNAVIKLSGTLTGNAILLLTLPRLYVIDNQCVVGTSYVQIAPASGTGTAVGLSPGKKTMVAFDGTNVDYVDQPDVGTFMMMAVSTTPPWMSASSKAPWLICNGATYSTSVFPALGNMLGSTFGGNGITTFGVPDTINRLNISVDKTSLGRVTSTASNIDGTTLGAAGGSQFMQTHTHGITDPGHVHGTQFSPNNLGAVSTFQVGQSSSPPGGLTTNATTNISINAIGSGSSQNMPPVIVGGLDFIKT